MNPEKLTTVKVEVTERLIKTGTVNDCVDCPVALAVRKVVSKTVDVNVLHDDITLTLILGEDDDFQQISTPARVAKFIEKFDERDPTLGLVLTELPPLPKPFSFNLRIQNKFLKPSLRK